MTRDQVCDVGLIARTGKMRIRIASEIAADGSNLHRRRRYQAAKRHPFARRIEPPGSAPTRQGESPRDRSTAKKNLKKVLPC